MTNDDTLGALATEVFRPSRSVTDPHRRRLLLARRAVAWIGAVATLVQVIVWLLIALFGGALDGPWWLWTAVPALAAVTALTVADRRDRTGALS